MQSTSDALTGGLAVWLPLVTGLLTVVVTVYGLHRTWQDRRRERRARLADLARVAVRVTEATYVRPLLRGRLEASVRRFLGDHEHRRGAAAQGRPSTARLLLFCQLLDDVGLTPEEKAEARTRAFNQLVDLLRGSPSPPVNVRGDARLARETPRLFRALELAYNLCPRPAQAMIADLGAFAGRVGTLSHGTGEASSPV